jgi:sugar phosphate isomerase/epimerase
MRLAIIGDEISQNLAVVIDRCSAHRFEGVEIRSVWGKAPLELDRVDCKRIREEVEGAGLCVSGFASPAFKSSLPSTAAERAYVRDTLARSIERAAWLGARFTRVFSFYRNGAPDPAAAAAEMRQPLLECRPPSGCRVLLENGMRTNNPDAEATLHLLRELHGLEIGVLWDPGNAWFSGYDRGHFAHSYELLRGRIGCVHVKDPVGSDFYTRLGDGEVDWRGIARRLAEDGFEGWISLETHWRTGRVLTLGERDTPYGDRFSDGGWEASNQCMAMLAAMVREPW